MAQRNSPHDAANKASRLIALYLAQRAALIDPATVNTVELAERLGIHRATAWRDIQELRELIADAERLYALIESAPIAHEKNP